MHDDFTWKRNRLWSSCPIPTISEMRNFVSTHLNVGDVLLVVLQNNRVIASYWLLLSRLHPKYHQLSYLGQATWIGARPNYQLHQARKHTSKYSAYIGANSAQNDVLWTALTHVAPTLFVKTTRLWSAMRVIASYRELLVIVIMVTPRVTSPVFI